MKIINRLNKITKKREKRRRNAKTNGSDGIFFFFRFFRKNLAFNNKEIYVIITIIYCFKEKNFSNAIKKIFIFSNFQSTYSSIKRGINSLTKTTTMENKTLFENLEIFSVSFSFLFPQIYFN